MAHKSKKSVGKDANYKREPKTLALVNEINDIALQADNLIDKSNIFMRITTRGADSTNKSLVDFKVFDNKKLAKLAKNMSEINRATNVFGKQNSQTTSKMMSLNMVSQSPYRRLKQCLAQIERKRSALKENVFRIRKEKIKMDRILYRRKQLEDQLNTNDIGVDQQEIKFKIDLIDVEIQKKASGIADSTIYIEGALKEIGMYQESYYEIKESYNIPDSWNEEDYEKAEIEEHIKTAFLHAIRDLEMNGRLNVGTHEYLEQYGVNPQTAVFFTRDYLNTHAEMISEGKVPNINTLYEFLDKMYDVFKDEYKHAMKRTGLKNIISTDFLYLDQKSLVEDPDESESL
jgi:hypothetical protein